MGKMFKEGKNAYFNMYKWKLIHFILPCKELFAVHCASYFTIIHMIFSSSLPPIVCGRVHVLFTLFVFVCVWRCSAHIVLCFYIPAPPDGRGGCAVYCFTSVHPSIRPRYF